VVAEVIKAQAFKAHCGIVGAGPAEPGALGSRLTPASRRGKLLMFG
jgi:hypothetical protein